MSIYISIYYDNEIKQRDHRFRLRPCQVRPVLFSIHFWYNAPLRIFTGSEELTRVGRAQKFVIYRF